MSLTKLTSSIATPRDAVRTLQLYGKGNGGKNRLCNDIKKRIKRIPKDCWRAADIAPVYQALQQHGSNTWLDEIALGKANVLRKPDILKLLAMTRSAPLVTALTNALAEKSKVSPEEYLHILSCTNADFFPHNFNVGLSEALCGWNGIKQYGKQLFPNPESTKLPRFLRSFVISRCNDLQHPLDILVVLKSNLDLPRNPLVSLYKTLMKKVNKTNAPIIFMGISSLHDTQAQVCMRSILETHCIDPVKIPMPRAALMMQICEARGVFNEFFVSNIVRREDGNTYDRLRVISHAAVMGYTEALRHLKAEMKRAYEPESVLKLARVCNNECIVYPAALCRILRHYLDAAKSGFTVSAALLLVCDTARLSAVRDLPLLYAYRMKSIVTLEPSNLSAYCSVLAQTKAYCDFKSKEDSIVAVLRSLPNSCTEVDLVQLIEDVHTLGGSERVLREVYKRLNEKNALKTVGTADMITRIPVMMSRTKCWDEALLERVVPRVVNRLDEVGIRRVRDVVVAYAVALHRSRELYDAAADRVTREESLEAEVGCRFLWAFTRQKETASRRVMNTVASHMASQASSLSGVDLTHLAWAVVSLSLSSSHISDVCEYYLARPDRLETFYFTKGFEFSKLLQSLARSRASGAALSLQLMDIPRYYDLPHTPSSVASIFMSVLLTGSNMTHLHARLLGVFKDAGLAGLWPGDACALLRCLAERGQAVDYSTVVKVVEKVLDHFSQRLEAWSLEPVNALMMFESCVKLQVRAAGFFNTIGRTLADKGSVHNMTPMEASGLLVAYSKVSLSVPRLHAQLLKRLSRSTLPWPLLAETAWAASFTHSVTPQASEFWSSIREALKSKEIPPEDRARIDSALGKVKEDAGWSRL
eukprot:TRINITY_DN14209_c1_g4_i1.p1 TRINITY_DN14209_c1_g4~~TRINITY_DN14209_c1_g4_i1.p1  ORF type:complete len:872 (+),score=122.49 TRINITY_DN14209_c1_g4_i1:61-2676(+)